MVAFGEQAPPTGTATARMTPTPTVPVLRICDVTRNGGITTLDATRVLQFVAGIGDLDDEQRQLADASGNGEVSTLDAVMILRWVVGQHDAAPRCGTPVHP